MVGLFRAHFQTYCRLVVDVDLLPQNGRVVLVVLQDGRQLEGELRVMSGPLRRR